MGEAKRRLAHIEVTGHDWGRRGYKSPGRRFLAHKLTKQQALFLVGIVGMFTEIQRTFGITAG